MWNCSRGCVLPTKNKLHEIEVKAIMLLPNFFKTKFIKSVHIHSHKIRRPTNQLFSISRKQNCLPVQLTDYCGVELCNEIKNILKNESFKQFNNLLINKYATN